MRNALGLALILWCALAASACATTSPPAEDPDGGLVGLAAVDLEAEAAAPAEDDALAKEEFEDPLLEDESGDPLLGDFSSDPLFDEEFDDPLLEEEFLDPADRDPAEPLNRLTFGFNEGFRRFVLDPITWVYELVIPDPGRRAVFRFFANLEEPVIFLNDVLQLAPGEAGTSGARFLINTTVGLVGLFDPAASWGLERHETDFGQTLALYTISPGPYFVIPVLGPATARDALGVVVDSLLRPDTWLLGLAPRVVIGAGSGIATYDMEQERLDALRETSVDFYAAFRGAALLDREASVNRRIERVRGETAP